MRKFSVGRMTTWTDSPLSAVVRGTGPGLLLAHGASSSVEDSFGGLLDMLAAGNTVVAPDYPGSGDTPRAEGPLDLDTLTDQLLGTALAAGRPTFAILGYSTGSPIAVRLAARHPDRVTALVLTAGFARPNPRLRLVVDTWRALAGSDRETLLRYLMLIGFSAPWLDQRSPAEIESLLREFDAALPPGADEQLDLLTRVDVREDLARIDVPTLVISPTADQVTSPAHSRELAEGIPGAQLVEIESGHAIGVERAAEWATAVTDFLRGTPYRG